VASPMTADGLVRRVPGASLAPSLRGRPAAMEDTASAAPANGPPESDWRRSEQTGSMLSRFQASQRAGRAVAASGLAERRPDPADEAGT